MLSNEMARALRKMYKQYNIVTPKFQKGEWVRTPNDVRAEVVNFDYKGNVCVKVPGFGYWVYDQNECELIK